MTSDPHDALRAARVRRQTFDQHAETYDRVRPGYPDQVYERLVERCGLGPGVRVLELGPGTGQATGPLLDLGAEVVAVELGPEMAAVLRTKLSRRPLSVVEGDFDTIELPDQPFDLAVAATAFHWVDPAVALPKLAAALGPAGWLGVWRTVYYDPDHPTPFADAVTEMLEAHGSGDPAGAGMGPAPLDHEGHVYQLLASGCFADVEVDLIRWRHTASATETAGLFATYSNLASLSPERRDALLAAIERMIDEDFGGRVTRNYVTPLYTARSLGVTDA